MRVTTPIHKAAAKEAGRYTMHAVKFDRDDNGSRLVATDGRILAVVPVDGDGDDVPGLLPVESIAAALKLKGNKKGTLSANGRADVPGGPSFERPEGDFPRYAAVIPDENAHEWEIALDARLLLRLQQALGAESVRLKVSGPKNAIRVEGGRDGYGVIMPVTLD